MFHPQFHSFRARVAEARESGDLYFASLLDRQTIAAVFGEASGILDSARVFTTAATLWVFLSQVLSVHHGCVSAVAKLVTYRVARGLRPCSSKTGGYCIARNKLDEAAMQRLVVHTGRTIDDSAPDQWLWLGHRVITADGTTVTMADTPENQSEYPQQRGQQPGCGFPIMRLVVMFALSTGVVLESAMGKYRGKLTLRPTVTGRCSMPPRSRSATKTLAGCRLGHFGVLHTWGRDPMIYHLVAVVRCEWSKSLSSPPAHFPSTLWRTASTTMRATD